MSKLDRMQGTPWHIGALSRQEGDPRRHRAYCANYDKDQKYCMIKNMRCMGSAHCDEYKDSTNCLEKIDEEIGESSSNPCSGRKMIPIGDVYPGKFVLQKIEPAEIETEKRYYSKHGSFSGNVVVKLCVSKYYIDDGYLYYCTAKKMGHKKIYCVIRSSDS